MSYKFYRIAGPAVVLAILAWVFVAGTRAQQAMNPLRTSSLTTNWIGCLVAGKEDALDRIAPGPSPTVVRQVEIGLRSDGVVVWRNISPAR
jgi:hypothetical protein